MVSEVGTPPVGRTAEFPDNPDWRGITWTDITAEKAVTSIGMGVHSSGSGPIGIRTGIRIGRTGRTAPTRTRRRRRPLRRPPYTSKNLRQDTARADRR